MIRKFAVRRGRGEQLIKLGSSEFTGRRLYSYTLGNSWTSSWNVPGNLYLLSFVFSCFGLICTVRYTCLPECAEEIPFTVEKFEARPRKYLMTSQSAPLLKDTSNWVKRQHDHTRTTDNIPPLTPESKNMRILYEQESPFMMTIQNSRSSNMRETDRVRLPEHEWQDACTESLRKALFIQPQQVSSLD